MYVFECRKCGTKIGICVENRTYVGTSFIERREQNEVGMYICVVRMKLKGVT